MTRLRRTLRLGGGHATCYASIAPLKDCECVVHGASVACPAFVRLLHLALRTLLDRCGVCSFNASVAGLTLSANAAAPAEEAPGGGVEEDDLQMIMFGGGGVTARVLSRGQLTSRASDFGALEVFGGASIGHTSPWGVLAALDAEAAERGVTWAA